MDYLKKYISFNLFAFYGYFVLSRFILYWKNYDTQLFYFGLLQNCAESILISFIFPILFLCEFIILQSQIFNRLDTHRFLTRLIKAVIYNSNIFVLFHLLSFAAASYHN